MAFTEIDLRRIEKDLGPFMEKRRPPPHIRPELDLRYRISGQSLEIYEVRPDWQNPKAIMENPIAKATYVKTQDVWKVFWQRADLKWHRYDPLPMVERLAAFLKEVDRDPYGCFFG